MGGNLKIVMEMKKQNIIEHSFQHLYFICITRNEKNNYREDRVDRHCTVHRLSNISITRVIIGFEAQFFLYSEIW